MRFLVALGIHKFVVSLLHTIGRVRIAETIPSKGSPPCNGHKYESHMYVWQISDDAELTRSLYNESHTERVENVYVLSFCRDWHS